MYTVRKSILQTFVRRASNRSTEKAPVQFRFGLHEKETIDKPRIVSPVDETNQLQGPRIGPRDGRHINKLADITKKHGSKKQFDKNKTNNRISKKDNESEDILYGIHPVYLALHTKRRKIHHIYYKRGLDEDKSKINEIIDLGKQRNIKISQLPLSQLKQIVKGDKVHQGICCKASYLPVEMLTEGEFQTPSTIFENIDETPESKKLLHLWLYLDQIHDPMNFGAILRSAYYLGVDKILTSKEHSCRISGIVSKASSGVAELFPVYQVNDTPKLFGNLRESNWNIVSSSVPGSQTGSTMCLPIEDFVAKENTLLVIGNEGRGVSPELTDLCTSMVSVPARRSLHLGVDSLNVSVATSIILHTLRKKLDNV